MKSLTTKPDSSPELKKGEIKEILIKNIDHYLSDFYFSSYKNGCYNFERIRNYNGFRVWETLHIVFGHKDKNFVCSVASRLNHSYNNSNSYNTGLINPHSDLISLKKNKALIPIEEAYYFHNGHIHATTEVVKDICEDYEKYGLPFLEKQLERLKQNAIVNAGLDYILALNIDKENLKTEIETELKKAGHAVSRLKHPAYVNLKETLQSIDGQTREDRQKIPKLAYELLELFWSRQ